MWRCLVVAYPDEFKRTQYCFSLAVHMAISDGLNVITLLIEIINIINSLETESKCDEMLVKLEPPENSISLCHKTKLFKEEEHKKRIDELANAPIPRFLFDDMFKSENETGFALDLLCLDQNSSERIVKMTKKYGLRVTSYFQAVTMYALRKLYTENNLELQASLPIYPILTLRVRFDPVYEFYNCRYYTAYFSMKIEESFDRLEQFWRISKNIHNQTYSHLEPNDGSMFAVTHNFDTHNKLNRYIL